MANAKEIQDRMKSINDTLKITNAMYMISSSKLKKSKKMLTDTEPYFFTLQSEMSRILRHLPDLDSIYFRSTDEIPEEEKRIAYMVVTADKGLAGSYNHNILKIAEEELAKHPKRQLYVLGEVGRHYFEERGIEINKQFHYTIQNPTLNRARNISEELLEDYRQGEFDEIYIIYTSMVNAMQEDTSAKTMQQIASSVIIVPWQSAKAFPFMQSSICRRLFRSMRKYTSPADAKSGRARLTSTSRVSGCWAQM